MAYKQPNSRTAKQPNEQHPKYRATPDFQSRGEFEIWSLAIGKYTQTEEDEEMDGGDEEGEEEENEDEKEEEDEEKGREVDAFQSTK